MGYPLLVVALLFTAQAGFVEQRLSKVSQFYDHTVSLKFFHYTKVAKCSVDDIISWNCGYYCDIHPGMVDVQAYFETAHHSQAYCGYNTNENIIAIVYRSTQDIVNWINNFKFVMREFGDCDNCKVHMGFWQTYNDLSEKMMACVDSLKAKYPTGEIMITGHSLGGAIAALTAVDVTRRGIKVHHFYTYGAPRVGNDEFESWFITFVAPTESWRVTHNRDTVVHLPPKIYGYQHIPQEVWYNKDSSAFTICATGLEEDPNCANSVTGDSTGDHTSYFNEFEDCRESFVE